MKSSRLHLAAAAVAALGLASLGAQGPARAQASDFYVGQLGQFGTNWCPDGWHRADGSLLSIAAESMLFSLIGTTFGGDGINTFALPDLRDRAPVGMSSTKPLGAVVGAASTIMIATQLPAHTHGFNADPTPPVGNSPGNSMLGVFPAGQAIYASPAAAPDTPMNFGLVQPTGNSQPVPTQMPVLPTNWCIALSGTYPQRP